MSTSGEPTTRPAAPYWAHPSADVEQPCQIGDGTRIWRHCHVMSGARIGVDCMLGQGVFVASEVELGDRVRVQNHVSLFAGVRAEDDVFIGPSCVFTNVKNPRTMRKQAYEPTLLKRGCTVGANATIVCGVTIGAYAFVAAGAVVTKDVAPHSLVMGVPARPQGLVSHQGVRLDFDSQGLATCSASGDRYLRSRSGLELLAE